MDTIASYLEDLNWRYATKKFNPERRVPDATLDQLLEAVRLSPSSYGLQPYEVLVITDAELREKLRPACWDQSQITEASHLLVFANKSDFGPELIDSYIDTVSETRKVPRENLKNYADFMKSKILDLPQEARAEWTARQVYIALGNLLSAAAAARVDACPMEGFDAEQVNTILNLGEKGLNAAVIATLGYRSDADNTRHQEKVRRPKDELFTHI